MVTSLMTGYIAETGMQMNDVVINIIDKDYDWTSSPNLRYSPGKQLFFSVVISEFHEMAYYMDLSILK